jgi:hypothetical protein
MIDFESDNKTAAMQKVTTAEPSGATRSMSNVIKIPFDYSGIDKPEEVREVEALAIQIEFYAAQTAMNAYETGKRLVLAKEIIGHGKWESWILTKFGWGLTTAKKMIMIAENMNNISKSSPGGDLIANFQVSALYLLASPSTPDSVRDEAIALAESGEKITKAKAKAMIEQAKAEARAEAAIKTAEAIQAKEIQLDEVNRQLRDAKEKADEIRQTNLELSQVTNMKIKRLDEANNRLKALEIEKAEIEKQLNEIKAKPAQVEVKEVVKEVIREVQVESEDSIRRRQELEAELEKTRLEMQTIAGKVAKTEQEKEDKDGELKKATRRALEMQKRLLFFEEEARVSKAVNLLIDAHANLTKSLEVLDISRSGRVIPECYQGVIENIINLATSIRTPTGAFVDIDSSKKIVDIATRG